MANWIAGAIKNPGALRKATKTKAGHDIPMGKLHKAAHSAGVMGQRARLAETLGKLRPGKKGK